MSSFPLLYFQFFLKSIQKGSLFLDTGKVKPADLLMYSILLIGLLK